MFKNNFELIELTIFITGNDDICLKKKTHKTI